MTTTLYEGTKRVHAQPMTRGAYNAYRGWQLPADENPADEGYLVEYVDGGPSNAFGHAGYISWSPKDVFERSYKEVKTVPGLAPHQQRVVDEHAECLERLRKLRAFIGDAKGPFRQLDDAERHRLMHQEGVIGAFVAGEFGARGGDTVAVRRGIASPDVLKPSLNLLTFCVLVLRNGFTVTGESACASPENFDAEIGRKVARQNAIEKIWPLVGYELRTKLAGSKA